MTTTPEEEPPPSAPAAEPVEGAEPYDPWRPPPKLSRAERKAAAQAAKAERAAAAKAAAAGPPPVPYTPPPFAPADVPAPPPGAAIPAADTPPAAAPEADPSVRPDAPPAEGEAPADDTDAPVRSDAPPVDPFARPEFATGGPTGPGGPGPWPGGPGGPGGPWPAAYPPPGYAMPYYGGAPYPIAPPPGVNGLAVASFVTGLLGVFPVGLGLGIAALVKVHRSRQKGTGLAVAGIVLSSLWLLVIMALVIGGAAYVVGHAGESPVDLKPGACFNLPNTHRLDDVKAVPCSGPHDRQLVADVLLGDGSYPGLEADKQLTRNACVKAMSEFLIDPAELAYGAGRDNYYPEQPAWQLGDPEAYCTFASTEPGGKLTGSLRQPASEFDATQRAYLRIIHATWPLRAELDDTLSDQWARQRAVATRLAAADRTEAAALRSPKAFSSAFLRRAAGKLADADLAQARDADTLAKVDSEADWQSAVLSLGGDRIENADGTIRANLELLDK
jgi:Domain of unknown function (DUF4190)/Septum formation